MPCTGHKQACYSPEPDSHLIQIYSIKNYRIGSRVKNRQMAIFLVVSVSG